TVTNNSTLQLDFASNSTLANQLSGTGALNKTSSGVATLTAASSSQGSVNVANGTLELAQSGAFTTSGAYTTRVGTATQIDQNAELNVGTAFTQEAGSNLVVMADTTSPKITAATASLGGTLTITGLSNGAAPAKSSQLPGNQYTLIQTTGGITGDFISTNIPGTGLDYLLYDGRVSSNGLDYDLGFRLAWTDGGYSQGTGDFTMVGGSTFEVDTVLSNQAGPFINGWDGKTLTKSGAGSLILSGQNIYTGATIIDGGTIYIANNSTTGVDGTIADSSNVAINSGTLDISKIAGTSTTIQNLSGTAIGNITLAGKNLTVDQSQNLTYAGNFDASNGSITKNGTGELTLSGQTLYTGNTTVNQGTLTLDGTSGGAQLVSNVIGTSGAVLNIINRASLTGTIDPLDVNITTGGIWNVTGNSNVLALTSNAGNINFIPPPVNSTNPADYKTITATSLNGSNGSTITMNTNLAANIGDRIDTKTTSGSQTININNTGGTISGTPLALEIINVANSTASTGTFTLGNAGGTVDVGVYKYQLVQGSTENNLSDVGSWYLAALENGGGGNGGGGGGQPELSNQAQSIIAASDQAGTWIMQTDSLLQRMGELRITDYNQAKHGMQSWVRGYGWQANVNTNNSQVAYKSTEYGFDAGTDVTTQFENSKLSTGIFAGMSLDKRRIGDNAGHDNIDTIYGGIYGTWVTSKGFHIDAVGRGGYLDTEVNANDAPNYSKAKYNNWGILGSLEIGQQLKSENGWYIEPQIQGTIVHFTKADFTTSGDSLTVDQRASTSYDVRAGIVAGKSIKTERAGTIQPYIKGMYGQTWTNGGDLNIDGANFKGNSAGNRIEAGGGVVWQVTGDKQFYADYEYVKGPRMEVPWKVSAGFRVVW
ncbi:MAG: autotransporter outer membrane beta-barrel domain-containing protein, partial [Desulfuromonadales bacterium]|nr:autotransporter outer membrane beta-barrel domain-containing protein [Desulfuromonadales bacterium]